VGAMSRHVLLRGPAHRGSEIPSPSLDVSVGRLERPEHLGPALPQAHAHSSSIALNRHVATGARCDLQAHLRILVYKNGRRGDHDGGAPVFPARASASGCLGVAEGQVGCPPHHAFSFHSSLEIDRQPGGGLCTATEKQQPDHELSRTHAKTSPVTARQKVPQMSRHRAILRHVAPHRCRKWGPTLSAGSGWCMSTFLRISAPFFVLATAGHSEAPGDAVPADQTRARIENQNSVDMDIYVRRSDGRVSRLGFVPGNENATFALPAGQPLDPVRGQVVPRIGRAGCQRAVSGQARRRDYLVGAAAVAERGSSCRGGENAERR